MPETCSVPLCRNNYKKRKNEDSECSSDVYVLVFRFPKCNEALKEKWLRSIHCKDWTPNLKSVICIKYFHESDIIRTENLKQGKVNGKNEHLQNFD